MATQVLAQTLGPIENGTVYPLDDFKARTGLGSAALRTARRDGLVVKYIGGRAFIRGEDFISFVAANGKSEK